MFQYWTLENTETFFIVPVSPNPGIFIEHGSIVRLTILEQKSTFLFCIWDLKYMYTFSNWFNPRVRISARVRESTLAETSANESERLLQTPPRGIQMDSRSSLRNSTPAILSSSVRRNSSPYTVNRRCC